MVSYCRIVFLFTAFFAVNTLCAQVLPGMGGKLPAVRGWADDSHYIQLNREGKQTVPYRVDARTGEASRYEMPKRKFVPGVKLEKGDIVYYASQKEKQVLTETQEEEQNPTLSPDGKWVAFTRANDLYAIEIATGKEVRYTMDGSEVVKNGYASWVYYEEILGRSSKYRAFWWSPDSRHLAFFRSDDTHVPVFPIYNARGQHGYTEMTRYPKAGDPNPEVNIGIVPVEGGKIAWADFNPKTDQYFGMPFWRPDGSGLLVQWMPREQDNLKLYDINPSTGEKQEIYDEHQPTWIDWIESIHWFSGGFLLIRDFDGWQQIYCYNTDGSLRKKLTDGNNWDTKIVKVDEEEGMVYFTSCGEISTRTDFYRVGLNGKGLRRLTFGDYTHKNISLSPDNSWFVTYYENVDTPTRLAVVEVKTGKIREVADSRESDYAPDKYARTEMLWMTTEDGFRLPAHITYPYPMEAGRRYPVMVQIYGGPNAGTVSERWTPTRYRTEGGCIRISIDHRGSGHCGKKGMNYMHRNLGKWEMQDYIAWVKLLRTMPCVDSTRVMISGGSYGGYITALALTYGGEYFQYGIAKYGVMDWRLYDSHYTERYMDHPKDNPEGYRAASVLTYAERYQTHGDAMLRIVHGLMDDNVHMQNSIQLVDTLQHLNKRFELMVYPNERHGWMGVKGAFTAGDQRDFIQRYLLRRE